MANAVDRARASMTGGAGKPLTLPHDWSGFEKAFAPVSEEALAARHPNIQSVQNPPPVTGQRVAKEPDVNSAQIQAQLNAAARPEGPTAAESVAEARDTRQNTETPYGTIAVHKAPPADWQQQVMKNHPEIAVKGSPENKAFIAAYKEAKAKGEEFDPIALAKNTVGGVADARAKAAAEEKSNAEIMDSAEKQLATERAKPNPLDVEKAKDDAYRAALAESNKTRPAFTAEEKARANVGVPSTTEGEPSLAESLSGSGAIKSALTKVASAMQPQSNVSPTPDFPAPGQPGGRPGGTGGVTSALPEKTPTTQPPNPEEPIPPTQPVASSEEVQNYANGFDPTKNESGNELAADQAFKANMTAANTALRNDNAAAGFPNQAITTQEIAGKPSYTAYGYNPTSEWNGRHMPNYASGKKPFRFAKPMADAMAREKTAIKHHVGGAPKSAKPMPAMIDGKPAVINSSEEVVPNAAGGTAVLNRNMQRKPFHFTR